jgi:hypothetical protein
VDDLWGFEKLTSATVQNGQSRRRFPSFTRSFSSGGSSAGTILLYQTAGQIGGRFLPNVGGHHQRVNLPLSNQVGIGLGRWDHRKSDLARSVGKRSPRGYCQAVPARLPALCRIPDYAESTSVFIVRSPENGCSVDAHHWTHSA